MTGSTVSRRQALSVLASSAFAARLGAQERLPRQRQISHGMGHALLLEPDGTVKIWSSIVTEVQPSGEMGQGHNGPIKIFTLYTVPGLRNVVSVAAGRAYSFAVLADGRMFSWGSKYAGILGITTLAELEINAFPHPDAHSPTQVLNIADAVAVSTTESHALALARNGTVYAWGEGGVGQLGIGPLPVVKFRTHAPSALSYVPYPVRIPGLAEVTAVATGGDHSLALLKDGTIRAWGENKLGQVGDGTLDNRMSPVVVPGVRTAVAIGAGASYSAALLADGTVMTWGSNVGGYLGRSTASQGPDPKPAPASGVKDIVSIAAGLHHVLALTGAGTVVAWGYDGHGATGQRSGGNGQIVPKVVPRLANVNAVFTGPEVSHARLSDGKIMTWGWVPSPEGRITASAAPVPLTLSGPSSP